MFSYVLQIVGTEWIWIIFLVVFLLFGSKKLPELSRAIGKAMGDLQRGREEIEREFRLATSIPKPQPLPENLKESPQSSRLAKAAENIELESKGKSDEELRKEIIRFMSDEGIAKKEEPADKQTASAATKSEPKPNQQSV
jgi:sec-independent protein translocase protein TatA